MQDQQAVTVIAQQRRAFDGAREMKRLFKATVGDFKLVTGDALLEERVAAASRNTQRPASNRDFEFFGSHTRQVNFHNPPIRSAINVCIGSPHTRPRSHSPGDRHHPKISFD
jgi:hypothetical protein